MMVDKFKVGYYYKFIGDENHYLWNNETKTMSDNKWHKCIYTEFSSYPYTQFEGNKDRWYWYKEDFIESKYPPEWKVKKLLKEI